MLSDHEIEAFINSGIIELVTMELADEAEKQHFYKMAAEYPSVRQAWDAFALNLEGYIRTKSVSPSDNSKPLLMAVIEYQERIAKGENIHIPPVLHPGSSAADYLPWLNNTTHPASFSGDGIHARIFNLGPTSTLGVVWIKTQSAVEIHEHELESFLILEGSCDIIVGNKKYQLVVGDYFEVPLFSPHQITVTSSIPCKAILQRLAA